MIDHFNSNFGQTVFLHVRKTAIRQIRLRDTVIVVFIVSIKSSPVALYNGRGKH